MQITWKKAALNEEAKNFILNNEVVFKVLKKAANRYIGGETIKETLLSVQEWNEKDANEATAEFMNFARAVKKDHLHSSISLDLSHIGLLISKELAMGNLKAICEEAGKMNQEVIISMEGTNRTDSILEVYKETLKAHKNLGITLQA